MTSNTAASASISETQRSPEETAASDARIEAGLKAAQTRLQARETPQAAQILEALADAPGTRDQQARYALLMGELRLAQGRTDEARRWLERAAGTLPPALESQRLEALVRLSAPSIPNENTHPALAPATTIRPGVITAVLLPTQGRLEATGRAIQDGLLQAYLEQAPDQRPTVKFFAIDDQPASAITAAQQALQAGAGSIIGPLDKPAVEAVARKIPASVPMLALNRADIARKGLIQFGLPPEDEARIAARRALASGRRAAWVIIPRNEWGERLLAGFTETFTPKGGHILQITRYSPSETDFQALLKQGWGGAGGADMIFLAAFAPQAHLLCPQIRFVGADRLPIYATSAIDVGSHGGAGDQDLEGVRFPEMPWLLLPNQGTRTAQDFTVARMQAFGFDAYHLWQQLVINPTLQNLRLMGATGELSLTTDGRVERIDLPWAYFSEGRIVSGLPADESAAMIRP